jgi:hypothetical protein
MKLSMFNLRILLFYIINEISNMDINSKYDYIVQSNNNEKGRNEDKAFFIENKGLSDKNNNNEIPSDSYVIRPRPVQNIGAWASPPIKQDNSSHIFYPNTYTETDMMDYANTFTANKATFSPDLNVLTNPDPFNLLPKRNFKENNKKIKRISATSEFELYTKFPDVVKDIQTLKTELFDDANQNMDFYKRNRNAYNPQILRKSMKIAKILELEELLEFYTNSNKQ